MIISKKQLRASFGERIRELRAERMTGQELADRMTALGVPTTKAQISAIENGQGAVSLERLAAFCWVLGLELVQLEGIGVAPRSPGGEIQEAWARDGARGVFQWLADNA